MNEYFQISEKLPVWSYQFEVLLSKYVIGAKINEHCFFKNIEDNNLSGPGEEFILNLYLFSNNTLNTLICFMEIDPIDYRK